MAFQLRFGKLPHVVGISSSLKPDTGNPQYESLSRTGVNAVLAECEKKGATTDFIDLRDSATELPLCDGREAKITPYRNSKLLDIETRLRQADAVIIGTPNYKGGYTGTLKNLFDLLPLTLFINKYVSFVISSGNPLKAMVPVAPLTSVVSEMQGHTLPNHVFLIKEKIPGSGEPVAPETVVAKEKNQEQIQKASSELLYYARINANARLNKPSSLRVTPKSTALEAYA